MMAVDFVANTATDSETGASSSKPQGSSPSPQPMAEPVPNTEATETMPENKEPWAHLVENSRGYRVQVGGLIAPSIKVPAPNAFWWRRENGVWANGKMQTRNWRISMFS